MLPKSVRRWAIGQLGNWGFDRLADAAESAGEYAPVAEKFIQAYPAIEQLVIDAMDGIEPDAHRAERLRTLGRKINWAFEKWAYVEEERFKKSQGE